MHRYRKENKEPHKLQEASERVLVVQKREAQTLLMPHK